MSLDVRRIRRIAGVLAAAVALLAVAGAGCKGPAPGGAPDRSDARVAAAARVAADARVAAAARVAASDGGAAASGPAVPAGTLLADEGFAYTFAVFAARPPREKPGATVSRLLAAGPLALGTGEVPATSETPAVWVRQPALSEQPLPASPVMRGLSPAAQAALPRTRSQTRLDLRGPPTQALMAYAHALAMADALARASGGVIYDAETNELFSRQAWAERINGWSDNFPDVALNVRLESRPGAGAGADRSRMQTVGMGKLALPDVAADGVAAADVARTTALIQVVCQTLLEGARLSAPGKLPLAVDALKQTTVRERATRDLPANLGAIPAVDLVLPRPREGDPRNRLVEIVQPR